MATIMMSKANIVMVVLIMDMTLARTFMMAMFSTRKGRSVTRIRKAEE